MTTTQVLLTTALGPMDPNVPVGLPQHGDFGSSCLGHKQMLLGGEQTSVPVPASHATDCGGFGLLEMLFYTQFGSKHFFFFLKETQKFPMTSHFLDGSAYYLYT